jgi:hypothetical protein
MGMSLEYYEENFFSLIENFLQWSKARGTF